MLINRMSEEKKAPQWFHETSQVEIPDQEFTRIASINSINDNNAITEFEKIDSCATNKTPYFYNTKWASSCVNQLKEYAIVNNLPLDSFIGVDASAYEIKTTKTASSSSMVKTASANENTSLVDSLKNALGDPFHITERTESTHMDKVDWQKTSGQSVLKQQPQMNGGIVPLAGGEDYNTNSNIKVAPGQNSISDPDAIGKLINNTAQDNGARLKAEKVEKEQAKIAEKKNWEDNKLKEMEHNKMLPKGKVFPTESMVAQSGLNSPSSQRGVYAKFDPADIPDKTKGEQIAENNEARKKSIQREIVKEDGWQKPQTQSARGISDIFSSELAKLLKKD